MKDAMWSVAKDGSYRFDGVRRHQPLLLSEDAFGFDELVADLVDAFGRNEWIPVEKLDEFMAGDGTLFRKSHLRSKVLKPLQDLEVWPESHWPGFALRQADVLQSYTA